jgi:hypothetical protein
MIVLEQLLIALAGKWSRGMYLRLMKHHSGALITASVRHAACAPLYPLLEKQAIAQGPRANVNNYATRN